MVSQPGYGKPQSVELMIHEPNQRYDQLRVPSSSYQGSTMSLFTKGVQGEVDTDAETRLKDLTRSTRGSSTKQRS